MRRAGSDRTVHVGHAHRRAPVRGGTVAQLTIVVASPGEDGPVILHRQAMGHAGVHHRGVRQTGDLNGPTAIGSGTIAQLAVGVLAPRPSAPVILHGQSVVVAGGNGSDIRQIACPPNALHLDGGSDVIHHSAIAQLAVGVRSPGPGGPVALHSHAVPVAAVNRRNIGQVARSAGAHYADRGVPVRPSAIAQPAAIIGPPSIDVSIPLQGQAMTDAGANRANTGQIAGPALSHHLNRGITGAVSSTIAQLTVRVPSPGPDSSIAPQREAMPAPGSDGDNVREEAGASRALDLDRGTPVRGGAIAQLTFVVVAKRINGPVALQCEGVTGAAVAPAGERLDIAERDWAGSAASRRGSIAQLASVVGAPGPGPKSRVVPAALDVEGVRILVRVVVGERQVEAEGAVRDCRE